MDLLRGNIKHTYFKYLGAAFGSAMLASVYSLVDMAMVGQYQGPDGAAALGFTVILAAASWLGLIFFEVPLLRFFGGDEALIPLARDYLYPVKFSVPFFLFTQMLAAFLRNDGRPALATGAVLSGGVFNVLGDYFFVFVLDLGIMGAGIATCLGAAISCLVMLTHFLSPRNTLRLVPVKGWIRQMGRIGVTGFSAFFADIAMGILTILFNRQIMHFLGTDALAVYGVLVNVSTLVQCCAYSVGQASQPILSLNYGARQTRRILDVLRYALGTVAVFGVLWVLVLAAFPTEIVRLFMAPTPEVLEVAPGILRTYGLSFLLLPFNIFSAYYFQSILRPASAFGISVTRGLVVSGGLILTLPALWGGSAIWLAMPLTELVVALAVAGLMVRSVRQLKGEL